MAAASRPTRSALREVARAYAMLADPRALPAERPAVRAGASLTIIRDAMLANPEMVAGRHDRLDTSLMKAVPGRLVSKAGMEALRGVAILPGPRTGTSECRPPGWRSRSRTATATTAGPGRHRSRRSARPASSTAAPFGRWPATTGRRSSTRTAGRRRDDRRVRAGAGGRAHRLTAGRRPPNAGAPDRRWPSTPIRTARLG